MPTASPRASMSVSMCCEWFSTLTWDSSWKEPEVSNPWVKTGAWGTQNHGRSIGFWDLLHMFSGAFASKFRDQARSALSRNHVFWRSRSASNCLITPSSPSKSYAGHGDSNIRSSWGGSQPHSPTKWPAKCWNLEEVSGIYRCFPPKKFVVVLGCFLVYPASDNPAIGNDFAAMISEVTWKCHSPKRSADLSWDLSMSNAPLFLIKNPHVSWSKATFLVDQPEFSWNFGCFKVPIFVFFDVFRPLHLPT